jgi:hypothetical protein
LKIYRCPTDPTTSGDPFFGPCSYPTNNLICAKRTKIPLDFPGGTSRALLFAEKYGACSYWALTEGREVPWYVANEVSGFQIRPQECDPTLPQSPHRGCINVATADGATRTVYGSVSPHVWYEMNTTAGCDDLGEAP